MLNDDLIKQQFLRNFIEAAKFSGISLETSFEACIELGLEKNHFYLWFYNGLPQIVEAVEEYLDNEMLQNLKNNPIDNRITQKVRAALISRIYNNSKNKLILKALSRYYMKPNNITYAPKAAWKTVNKIWYYAGDKSVDWNYYSKRTIAFSIYSSAILYYLNNADADFLKTTKFIDRALAQIGKISKLKGRIMAFCS